MSRFLRYAVLGAAVTAPVGIYALVLRPWKERWGADPGEAVRMLPGDELVPGPTAEETRGITIAAAPEDVWPWLVQMGFGRAGWYSYDQMDMKGRSADDIRPELQSLAVGDTVPTHPGGGFVVKALAPGHALTLFIDSMITQGWKVGATGAPGLEVSGAALQATVPREFAGSWTFVVEPTDDGRTRLIERTRFAFPGGPSAARIGLEAMGFGVFLMMRKQMLGIRDRAERLARSKLPAPYVPPPVPTPALQAG